ncbi:hypothetical protein Tsubulata_023859 [Turnera subulata]|uniref:F-box/kelch-repeat protein n=1 Tax=Turnera subulata TaxID=218843 RepID=A0A9Q0F7W9_9ROSI|nr:hypothetical protein Tsubulata_023859 [Turnera subulata]
MKRKSNQSVCFSMLGSKNTYWYTFDLSNDGEDDRIIVPCRCNCGCPCAKRIRHDTTHEATPTLSPTKVLPKKDRNFLGWTVVGNQLYRLGGSFRDGFVRSVRTKTVRALDLTRNTTTEKSSNGGKWHRKARMLAPRTRQHTVVVGGKIYVLGGYMLENNADDTPWAEDYDPTSNIWEALPPPPKVPEKPRFGWVGECRFFWAGLEDDNDGEKGCIIVFSPQEELLLQYNVANKSWNMSKLERRSGDKPLGRIENPGGPAVAVGRMVYWFCGRTGCLYGFHIDTHILYASELVIDVPRDWSERPMLGHLGGHKFFLLHESLYQRSKAGQLMHCLKFSVDLVEARNRINVSLESSQSLVIKRPGCFSNGCVVMSSQSQRDFP